MTSTYDLMQAAREEAEESWWYSGPVNHHDLIEAIDDHDYGGDECWMCTKHYEPADEPAEPPVFPWQGARR